MGMFVMLAISCGTGNKRPENLAPNAHMVKVEEIIQTSMYTYARVTEEGNEYWVAINKADLKEGATYYWSQGGEMTNFTSKELKRTFKSIFFIQDFTDQPITKPVQTAPQSMAGKQQVPEVAGISVQKVEGGITVAELYAGKSSYAGKSVTIRGQVVKFSPAIMNKNWIHLQDGTKDGNNCDLTITTADTVKVGAVVILQGKVSLDKDFGAGYIYPVIIEDAIVKK